MEKFEQPKVTENKNGCEDRQYFGYWHQHCEMVTRGKSPQGNEHKEPPLDLAVPKPVFDQNITEEFKKTEEDYNCCMKFGSAVNISDLKKQEKGLFIEMKQRDSFDFIIGKMDNMLYKKSKILDQLRLIERDEKTKDSFDRDRIYRKIIAIINSKERGKQLDILSDGRREISEGRIAKLDDEIDSLKDKIKEINKLEIDRRKRYNTHYATKHESTLLEMAESQQVKKREAEMQSLEEERKKIDEKYNAFPKTLDNFISHRCSDWEYSQLEKKAELIIQEVEKELSSKWEKIPFLRDFPREQAWRLCVDERYQRNDGPKFDENSEPLFHAGTRRLLNAVIDGLDIPGLEWDEHSPEKLTVKLYEQLHDIAVADTYAKVRKGDFVEKLSTGFRPSYGNISFLLELGVNMSESGFKELQDKIDCRKGGPKVDHRYEGGHPVGNCHSTELKSYWDMKIENSRLGTIMNGDHKRYEWAVGPMEQAKLKENIKAILDTYHKEIDSATDEYAKLAAIARCCQDLEQAHAFLDGNGRTIAFGVLTKLLLENRLTPCIMHDTSHIDGFSVKEARRRNSQGTGNLSEVVQPDI